MATCQAERRAQPSKGAPAWAGGPQRLHAGLESLLPQHERAAAGCEQALVSNLHRGVSDDSPAAIPWARTQHACRVQGRPNVHDRHA